MAEGASKRIATRRVAAVTIDNRVCVAIQVDGGMHIHHY
jgi:hypothetical protein